MSQDNRDTKTEIRRMSQELQAQGLQVVELSNEIQVYDEGLLVRIWLSGDRNVDVSRVADEFGRLLGEVA